MIAPRTGLILKSIVEEYIACAVPVPSHTITARYGLGVSPATVRHEMVHLEGEGYIVRPHHSAGSIPLDKGYRYYVAQLRASELPLDEQHLISHLFYQVRAELEEWLNLAVTVAAQLTRNFAVATLPKSPDCRFKHTELISLDNTRALVVLVLQGAKVRQKLLNLADASSQVRLTAIASKLNQAFSGLTCTQMQEKKASLASMEQEVTGTLVQMMQAEDERDYGQPYLDGLHRLLEQPEFTEGRRVLSLMELVEERRLLPTIVPPDLRNPGVEVIIGRENRAEAIWDYSVVISRYGLPEAVGIIMVIGPTRMPYAHTMAAVSYLASVLSRLAAELYGKPPHDNRN
ncbi:MAG: heat-inducible transcriptional repressor HrcA [Chloroflexota bacterium]